MKQVEGQTVGEALEEGLKFGGQVFAGIGSTQEIQFSFQRRNLGADLALELIYRDAGLRVLLVRVALYDKLKNLAEIWVENDLGKTVRAIQSWVTTVDSRKRAEAIKASGLPESDFGENEEPLAP